MEIIFDFFNHPFFAVVGGLAILLAVLQAIYAIYLFAKGVIPVWIRLGMGLSKRKIAVFADTEFDSLESMLVDSEIFLKSNVVKIEKNSIRKAEGLTLFLVHWKCFKSEIDEILRMKTDPVALVIYAPQSEGFIENDALQKISQQRNTIIVNFRGRLLNDIFISMMTSSYKTK